MSSVEHDAADKVKHATFCPTQPDTVLRAAQPNVRPTVQTITEVWAIINFPFQSVEQASI